MSLVNTGNPLRTIHKTLKLHEQLYLFFPVGGSRTNRKHHSDRFSSYNIVFWFSPSSHSESSRQKLALCPSATLVPFKVNRS